MEFSNTLPGDSAIREQKGVPHISTASREIPPSYSTTGPEPPRYHNVRWTPLRCARYDYILHIISLLIGICTLALYVFDLAKSRSYQIKLPVGLAVVDGLAIAFACLSNLWSLNYLFGGQHTRMSRGETGRKWPTILDFVLHCGLLGLADTTLSMRSGGNCDQNRAVGGCSPTRRAVMIAAGIGLILVG